MKYILLKCLDFPLVGFFVLFQRTEIAAIATQCDTHYAHIFFILKVEKNLHASRCLSDFIYILI